MPLPSAVRTLYLARGLRGFGDGFATIILPAYLTAIGYDPIAIGIVLTASLLGTAIFTLAIGAIAPRHENANGRNAINQPMYCTPNPGASARTVRIMISIA